MRSQGRCGEGSLTAAGHPLYSVSRLGITGGAFSTATGIDRRGQRLPHLLHTARFARFATVQRYLARGHWVGGTTAPAACAQGHSVTLPTADKFSEFVRRSQARCARIDDHSTARVIKHANRDAAKRAVDSAAERRGRCVAFVDEGTLHARAGDATLELDIAVIRPRGGCELPIARDCRWSTGERSLAIEPICLLGYSLATDTDVGQGPCDRPKQSHTLLPSLH